MAAEMGPTPTEDPIRGFSIPILSGLLSNLSNRIPAIPTRRFLRAMSHLRLRGGVAPRSMDSGTPPRSRRRRDRSDRTKLKKGGDDGKKSLLEALLCKKKTLNEPPCSTTPIRLIPTPNPTAVARGVAILQSIFPKWESETLQVVLEANGFSMEDTIAVVLNMEQTEDATTQAAQPRGKCRHWPVKYPLPDDFLRVSGSD